MNTIKVGAIFSREGEPIKSGFILPRVEEGEDYPHVSGTIETLFHATGKTIHHYLTIKNCRLLSFNLIRSDKSIKVRLRFQAMPPKTSGEYELEAYKAYVKRGAVCGL